MGLFNRFKIDIKPLTKAPVENFQQSFEKLANQLMDNKLANANAPNQISVSDFEKLWGMSIPEELMSIYDQLSSLGMPQFSKWETAITDSSIVKNDENIFTKVLLKAQVEYPTDHHISWFTGSVSLDPVVNDGSRYNGMNISFQYPLYDNLKSGVNSRQIYTYTHNNQDIWGSSFEAMSKDVPSFLYIIMLIQAHNKKKISNNDFLVCFDKIKNKVKLPYQLFNSFRAGDRWVSYYDFNYRPENYTGSTLSLDYFNRSRWIFELLKGNHNNYLWSLQNSMYNRHLNLKMTKDIHRMNMENLPMNVPNALYYLLRCFFRDETSQLKEYIGVCKSSESKIIRDASAFADDLVHGLEFFGEIDNIQRLKTDFATNMNW